MEEFIIGLIMANPTVSTAVIGLSTIIAGLNVISSLFIKIAKPFTKLTKTEADDNAIAKFESGYEKLNKSEVAQKIFKVIDRFSVFKDVVK